MIYILIFGNDYEHSNEGAFSSQEKAIKFANAESKRWWERNKILHDNMLPELRDGDFKSLEESVEYCWTDYNRWRVETWEIDGNLVETLDKY